MNNSKNNSEDYTFKYCATTYELKNELRRLIDAYRKGDIDTQMLEDLIKEYSKVYNHLLYETKKPHYFKISIFNYLGQKRLNVLRNIIRVDADPAKLEKVEEAKDKRERKRLQKKNKLQN